MYIVIAILIVMIIIEPILIPLAAIIFVLWILFKPWFDDHVNL